MMKYELTFKADNVDELFDLFDNLKSKITNITVEIGDDTPTADDDTPTYTLIDVQRKFKDKASGGNKAHLREILQHYNAGRVSELDPKDYADVMQELDLVEA